MKDIFMLVMLVIVWCIAVWYRAALHWAAKHCMRNCIEPGCADCEAWFIKTAMKQSLPWAKQPGPRFTNITWKTVSLRIRVIITQRGSMHVIYKYELPDNGHVTVLMPEHQILTAEVQNNNTIVIWAIIDTDTDLKATGFHVWITGQELPPEHVSWTYINTIQMFGGKLVFHIFKE